MDILAQLQQLAGSPQGQSMMKALMGQMQGGGGADPRNHFAGGRPNMDNGGPHVAGAPPMAGFTPTEGATVPEPMGGTNGPTEYEEPPLTVDELSHSGMNPDGPTPEEKELLKSNPSPRNVANFNKLFGPGAAEECLSGKSTSYEDDVRGAMKDADEENHKKGIYGRRGRGEPLQGNELDDDD